MKKITLLVGLCVFIFSCSNKQTETTQNTVKDSTQVQESVTPDPQVAINFLNNYTKSEDKTSKWIKSCGLVTDTYITQFIAAEKEQQKALADGGEPIDIVTGNMDWCETGYVLREFDSKTSYVLASGENEMSGCDEKIDPVVVKIVQVGNKWFVDGSGAINLPQDAYDTFK